MILFEDGKPVGMHQVGFFFYTFPSFLEFVLILEHTLSCRPTGTPTGASGKGSRMMNAARNSAEHASCPALCSLPKFITGFRRRGGAPPVRLSTPRAARPGAAAGA